MSSTPKTVVKAYGRDCFLVLWNPFAAAFMSYLGLRVGLFSDAQVLDRMEKDALAMQARGYRVTASDEYRVALLFLPGRWTSYYRVTYERD
jgi:hypothetical protein